MKLEKRIAKTRLLTLQREALSRMESEVLQDSCDQIDTVQQIAARTPSKGELEIQLIAAQAAKDNYELLVQAAESILEDYQILLQASCEIRDEIAAQLEALCEEEG